jgi:hypothetical protein
VVGRRAVPTDILHCLRELSSRQRTLPHRPEELSGVSEWPMIVRDRRAAQHERVATMLDGHAVIEAVWVVAGCGYRELHSMRPVATATTDRGVGECFLSARWVSSCNAARERTSEPSASRTDATTDITD